MKTNVNLTLQYKKHEFGFIVTTKELTRTIGYGRDIQTATRDLLTCLANSPGLINYIKHQHGSKSN